MNYLVKILSPAGETTTLGIDAPDADAAEKLAAARGYRVFGVRCARARWPQLFQSQKFSVALFSQELLSLLDAGLGVVEALGALAQKSRATQHRHTLEALLARLGEGHSFSQALALGGTVFPDLFVGTVRASEEAGGLPEALRRYLAYHRQVSALRDKVVAASVYPALLLGVGFLVVLFLLGYVVPRFAQVYEDVGADKLPVLSRWLLVWGQTLGAQAWLFVLVTCTLMVVLLVALTRAPVRAAVERWLWRWPAIGEPLRIHQLARFTRTLAMLLRSGIPLVTALDMTGALLRQAVLRAGLDKAKHGLREGRLLSDVFAANGLATEVGVRLLVAGERSGEMGATMDRIANFYDADLARRVEWFTRLFEPVLMMVIGLVIGAIVILMYLPIFELASSIQ